MAQPGLGPGAAAAMAGPSTTTMNMGASMGPTATGGPGTVPTTVPQYQEASICIAQLRASMNMGCKGDDPYIYHGYKEVAVIGNGAYGIVYKVCSI